MYFRMQHFVVKFSKISSPEAARGIDSPKQNPADVPGSSSISVECFADRLWPLIDHHSVSWTSQVCVRRWSTSRSVSVLRFTPAMNRRKNCLPTSRLTACKSCAFELLLVLFSALHRKLDCTDSCVIHGVKWRHRIYGHDTIAILWV